MDKLIDLIKKLSAVGLLAAAAYLGETGRDGGFIKDLWAAAKTAGTFGCLFATLAWLDERRRSSKAQEELLERTISFVESSNQGSRALEKMTDAVKEIGSVIASKITTSRRRGR